MIKYIVVHHTAVSYKKNADQWKQTDVYHKDVFNTISSLGFYGGYNYEISAVGLVKQFRKDGEETCAQKGHNKDSISICLDLNGDIEMPTQGQTDALKQLIRSKMAMYNIPPENVVPHRYFATATIDGNPFIRNDTPFKTWDNCKPYKSCLGSKISDKWLKDLIGTSPIPEKKAIPDNLFAQLLALFKK